MKLFKTVNNEIIRECCSYFKFPLPSELLDKRRVKYVNWFFLYEYMDMEIPKQFYAMYWYTALFWDQDITC